MSRVLNLLGVDIGSRLVAGRLDNPKGYWENEDILDLHIALLRRLGHYCWDDVRPLPENWSIGSVAADVRGRMVGLLKREFGGSPIWGFKDPRTCRLMKLWHTVFRELGCKPHIVMMFRNPVEVASSLAVRNGHLLAKSLLAWVQHVLECERETRCYPRVLVSFDSFIADPEATTAKIASALEIEWPVPYQQMEPEIRAFMEPALKHHNVADETLDANSEIPEFVKALYSCLRSAEREGEPLPEAIFDRTSGQIVGEMRQFSAGGLIADLLSVRRTNHDLRHHIDDLGRQIGESSRLLGDHVSQIAQRDVQIAEKDDEIIRLQHQLAASDSAIAERDLAVAQMDSAIAQKDTEIAERVLELTVLRDKLTEIDSAYAQKELQLAELNAQLAENGARLAAILQSRSWRITSPLRYLFDTLLGDRTRS